MDHPDRKKFDDLQKWSLENGAQVSNIELKFYAEDQRGVHATSDIKNGEVVMFIPECMFLKLEMAWERPIGKLFYEQGFTANLAVGNDYIFINGHRF